MMTTPLHGLTGDATLRRAYQSTLDPRDHPAARAWARLHPELAVPTEVQKLQEKAKGAVYRLEGAGADGAAIVAKRSTPARILQECTVYEQVLPALDLHALRYHGFVEDREAACCWLFVDDAGDEAYLGAAAEHRKAAATWLAALHSSAARRRLALALPDRGASFYLGQLQSACATIARHAMNRALTADDVEVLHAIVGHCELAAVHWGEVEQLCARTPRTFVHGDFAPKNLRVRRDHPAAGVELLAFDWGSAGWGSIAADLVQWSKRDEGRTAEQWGYWANPDLVTYSEAVRELWPDLDIERVQRLANVGKLFRCLVCIALSAQSFATPWVERAARNMTIYEAEMASALRVAGWAGGTSR